MSTRTEMATVGGGCFWCTEAVYQELEGVLHVESGYAGGTVKNPTYQQICTGTTGHAEVIRVTFDPDRVSYKEVLDVFWRTHDPTTLNRQGADVGTQYRSVIFYHNDEQQKIAEQSKTETDQSGLWSDPVVTEISPLDTFYKAETYHQNYYRNNPAQPYCMVVIAPKMQKFRSQFADKLSA
jgi:peptide-methionine (S)-S-oxide reductase